MWNDTWGWRQACAIVAALGVVGIVLQIAVGHIPQGAFVFPQNIIWGSAFLLAIVVSYLLLGRYNKQVQLFFSGTVATLSSIGGLLAVLLIMGFTKQIPAAMGAGLMHPLHRIGFSHILSTWYFLLMYLYLLYVLGFVTIHRIRHSRLILRDIAFAMNHIGLFLAMFFGLLSAADMQRYRLQAYTDSEYPEWQGIDETTGKLTELPLAIELLQFEMQEYPPKLMIINNTSGKPIPLGRAESLSLDSASIEGNIARLAGEGYRIYAIFGSYRQQRFCPFQRVSHTWGSTFGKSKRNAKRQTYVIRLGVGRQPYIPIPQPEAYRQSVASDGRPRTQTIQQPSSTLHLQQRYRHRSDKGEQTTALQKLVHISAQLQPRRRTLEYDVRIRTCTRQLAVGSIFGLFYAIRRSDNVVCRIPRELPREY